MFFTSSSPHGRRHLGALCDGCHLELTLTSHLSSVQPALPSSQHPTMEAVFQSWSYPSCSLAVLSQLLVTCLASALLSVNLIMM